jgi:hypothetical protein
MGGPEGLCATNFRMPSTTMVIFSKPRSTLARADDGVP